MACPCFRTLKVVLYHSYLDCFTTDTSSIMALSRSDYPSGRIALLQLVLNQKPFFEPHSKLVAFMSFNKWTSVAFLRADNIASGCKEAYIYTFSSVFIF